MWQKLLDLYHHTNILIIKASFYISYGFHVYLSLLHVHTIKCQGGGGGALPVITGGKSPPQEISAQNRAE